MGLQLLFVVETNKKCDSDWIYIRRTIEHFYEFKSGHVKYDPIYMDGKTKYDKKKSEIQDKINKYARSADNNKTIVLCCFDCDDYDSKPDDMRFLDKARKFCTDNNYKFVWFCKDIERVYLGRKVHDSKKGIEAAKFKARKLIEQIDRARLSAVEFGTNRSNLLAVMDQIMDNLEDDTLIKRSEVSGG